MIKIRKNYFRNAPVNSRRALANFKTPREIQASDVGSFEVKARFWRDVGSAEAPVTMAADFTNPGFKIIPAHQHGAPERGPAFAHQTSLAAGVKNTPRI